MKLNVYNLSFSIFALYFLSFASCSTTEPDHTNIYDSPTVHYEYTPLEIETLSLINLYRINIGLNKLAINDYISSKCEEHNNYMIMNNVVNHDDFITRSNLILKTLGMIKVSENIAYNYKSPQGALDAWLKSPEHKEIIEGDYTCFGISIRENPTNGKIYYTNIFAKM